MINNDGTRNEKGISSKTITYFFPHRLIVLKSSHPAPARTVPGPATCPTTKRIEKKYMVETNKSNVNKEKEAYEVKTKPPITTVYETCILALSTTGFPEKTTKLFALSLLIACDDSNTTDCNS